MREAIARGYPGRKAWSIVGMKVHVMLRYAYRHGVSTLFLEDPDVLGRLRPAWMRNGRRLHRNYNWETAIFRGRVIEMIALKAPIYAIRVGYVDPRGTTHSREHDEAVKKARQTHSISIHHKRVSEVIKDNLKYQHFNNSPQHQGIFMCNVNPRLRDSGACSLGLQPCSY